ncbi:MAG: helix-turn-helix domain-containing protein [Thermodesulfobacteriota bacterium]|jgi:transcriptional regulator with XRE-family HTH domain
MFSEDTQAALRALGARLRQARLARNEPQHRFALRLAVSVPTLRKLEQGDPAVGLGVLAEALAVLGRLEDLSGVLAPPRDLFARWEAEQRPRRQRARTRRAAP